MPDQNHIDDALPFLRARAFGQIVVPTSGAPFGVHVPFFVSCPDAQTMRVEFHVSRRNPILDHIGEGCDCLLMCESGDAYISPDWYGTDDRVPTWAYAAVHLEGRAMAMPAAQTLAHLDQLSDLFEQRLLPKKPWITAKMNQKKLNAMLKAIVTVSIEVRALTTTRKDLGEKSAAERGGVLTALKMQDTRRVDAIIDLIEKSLV